MPIYEYKCEKCGTEIEIIQCVGEEPPFCKKCGTKLKRLISNTSFILKGFGWGADNYSKPKQKTNKEKI